MTNPKQIVEEFFAAIPERDFEKIRKLLHHDYSYTGGDGQRQEGADAGIAVGEMYASAFPDLSFEIKHMHVAGDVVVTEFTGMGTHLGDLPGIAPTGKRVHVPICNVIEVREGKIYSEREYWDSAVLMSQLGLDLKKQQAFI